MSLTLCQVDVPSFGQEFGRGRPVVRAAGIQQLVAAIRAVTGRHEAVVSLYGSACGGSFFTICPSRMTKKTWSNKLTSSRGLPGTAMMSASLFF